MKKICIKWLAIYWLIGFAILLFGRIALATLLISWQDVELSVSTALHACFNGLRFDCQALAYMNILPLLVFIIASFLSSPGPLKIMGETVKWYYALIYTILVFIEILDIGFYKNFGSHFNLTLFDFFDEAPATLIRTIWEEYPVIWLGLLLIVTFILLLRLKVDISQVKAKGRNYWILAGVIIFFGVGMRGSVTQFPLQVEDLRVSHQQKINDMVANPCYLLKKVYKEKKQSFELLTDDQILKRYGFNSEKEAYEMLGLKEQNLYTTIQQADTTLPKPNIIIMFCESWSGYLTHKALMDNDKRLLCGMEEHLHNDLLFFNYQSVQNGTIASIEDFVISAPFPRVFRSGYRFHQFPTSIATPLNQSGYETIFMSGMDQEWENVGESLKIQGFNEIIDKYSLLKSHPDYTGNSVGLFDHYLMKALQETLSEDKGKPKMIFVMTTTNHPPFVYPEDVKLPSLPDSFYDNPQWGNSQKIQEKYIRGYQYASYSMAGFLDRFKQSPYAANTIVIITGDHNVRTALAYGDDGEHVPTRWEFSVPLYIYLPPYIRNYVEKERNVDVSKWGDHHDLLPTVAPFAISENVPYLNIGKNLFDSNLTAENTVSLNTSRLLSNPEMKEKAQRMAAARECLLLLHQTRFLRSLDKEEKTE